MTKLYKIRFKREGQEYKTAVREGKELLEYNTAVEVMNNIKSQEVACWMFDTGEDGKSYNKVLEYIPSRTEEF